MGSLNVREISSILGRCPKQIHKYIRAGRLKAEQRFCYQTSSYIVSTKDFAKFLCETPHLRAEFELYLRYSTELRSVTPELREVSKYMKSNPDWFVYSAANLSKIFNVSPQSIHNWARKGYLEDDFGPGLYSRKSVIRLTKAHPRFYKFMPKRGETV